MKEATTESQATVEELPRISDLGFINDDMAPVPPEGRKWGTKDIAALWVSMSACIPTYMLASSLIAEGMNWWQAVLTIFLGNAIVLIPMILNAHAGTKYGIPFPVYCRASFGLLGANVPAMLRALVACGWFGIQAWIGGGAIYKILAIYNPAWRDLAVIDALGINPTELICFLAFWAINMVVIYRGIESIRVLLNIKAPLLIVLGLALLAWAYRQAHGFGPMLAQPSQFDPGGPRAGQFWVFFFPALTGMIGFWATLSLNIPDFSRYAYSQRDQALGQALGLPLTMGLYSFIGVAVTSATVVIYGETIWDPVDLLARFRNPAVLTVAMLSLCLATLATNLAANVVGPGQRLRAPLAPADLVPHRRPHHGCPRHPDPALEADRRPLRLHLQVARRLFVPPRRDRRHPDRRLLPDPQDPARPARSLPQGRPLLVHRGFNPAALIALAAGIAPCVPGFVGTVTAIHVNNFWMNLYHYAWFIGFGVSFAVYAALMKMRPADGAEATV